MRVLLVALASTLWLAGTAAQSQPISREQAAQSQPISREQAAQSLSQADAQARREAAGRLGEVGTTADVPLLVETLRDPDAASGRAPATRKRTGSTRPASSR